MVESIPLYTEQDIHGNVRIDSLYRGRQLEVAKCFQEDRLTVVQFADGHIRLIRNNTPKETLTTRQRLLAAKIGREIREAREAKASL